MGANERYGYIKGKRTCTQCGGDCSKAGSAMQGGNGQWRCKRCIGIESDRMVRALGWVPR